MPDAVDPNHLLLIGAGPGVGASVVRRFGREGFRATLERIFGAPGARGVAVYNAALPDPGEILNATIDRLRTAYDVDVLGAVIAGQVAAPVLRAAGAGTLLFTSGGFADHPVPALASLSMGKAVLRSAATLIAAGVKDDGIHVATIHDRRPGGARDGLRSGGR
jgi:NAD(P)-dependent dehydrogenase (short-subunit alcohol dehydrogenase family)